GEDERRHRAAGRIESSGVAPQPDKRLLDELFGQALVAQQAEAEAVEAAFVAAVQLGEGRAAVANRDLGKQRGFVRGNTFGRLDHHVSQLRTWERRRFTHASPPSLFIMNGRFVLVGAHAVITGGSSGIGLATATALAARGANVSLVARNEERLAAAAAQLRAEGRSGLVVRTAPADVSDAGALRDALASVTAEGGPCDVLV